ncbi:MAG TPA: LysM peptidoglycan-binding domain-containing protein [Saprospiraceae bacterium]|jgi:LysM repeat protein|nr:LysM peptidoglycan-binding domain-containing protein [Saprospiraceae bacterium]
MSHIKKCKCSIFLLLIGSVLCFGQNQSNRFFSSGTEIVTDVLPGNDIYYSHINDQGISIYSLAKIFQVSTEMVLKVNKIDPKDPNYDGKIVKIPIKKSRISFKPAAKSPKTNTLTLVYKVKKGETLYRIAKDYLNTDVKSLMSLNGKTTPDLNTGDSLIIGYLTVQNLDNRQITSKNPDPKIDFDTKNKAQRPSTILKTPVNTETSDEVKIVKYYLSDVIGFWDKSPSSHNNNFVLHNEAKPGTMMDVYNPMLKRHVRAKVLGKIPQSTYAEEVQIIINSSVARELGILDQRFKVNIKYEM